MRRRVRDLLLASLAACLVGACGLTPSGGRPTTDPAGTASTATAATVATGGASPSPIASSPSPAAASPGSPSAQPSIPTPGYEEEPPLALLAPGDGTSVPGKLGSWCYGSGCADIIPGPPDLQPLLELPALAAEMELALPAPYRFVYWRLLYRDADDDDGPMDVLAEGGTSYPDPDEVPASATAPLAEFAAVTMAGPPSGDWLLQLQLEFAGQTGNASYYWHAVVP